MIDLCVINFNTINKLLRFHDQLFSLDLYDQWKHGPFNVYIADNGSTDASAKIVELRPPGKRYTFVQNENIGYSAAANQLVAMGTGDIIGILNADVWLTPSDVVQIQQSFDESPDIAILGPKQRDEKGNITHAGIEGTNTHPKHRGWQQPDPDDVLYRDVREMVTVSGSAYFIRRSVWDDLTHCPVNVRWYRERFGNDPNGAFGPQRHYFEETQASYHARAHEYKIYYDGRISIGHSWHASHPVGSPQDQLFGESRKIFRDFCDYHGILHD